jgi:hypothetical protein
MASAMPREGDKDSVSLEEWEHCLKIVSYCVLRIGPALAPVLERVEREVERARRNHPMVRAPQHLEALAACRLTSRTMKEKRSIRGPKCFAARSGCWKCLCPDLATVPLAHAGNETCRHSR